MKTIAPKAKTELQIAHNHPLRATVKLVNRFGTWIARVEHREVIDLEGMTAVQAVKAINNCRLITKLGHTLDDLSIEDGHYRPALARGYGKNCLFLILTSERPATEAESTRATKQSDARKLAATKAAERKLSAKQNELVKLQNACAKLKSELDTAA